MNMSQEEIDSIVYKEKLESESRKQVYQLLNL